LNKPLDQLRTITCHLGNGASITAVKYGKSVDTSMGFTPLAGELMGTRCGDIDPCYRFCLADRKQLSYTQVDNYLNKECGVLGVSGISSDFRDLEVAEADGNERAKLAIDMFCYQVRKFIGLYAAAMGGVDDIVFHCRRWRKRYENPCQSLRRPGILRRTY